MASTMNTTNLARELVPGVEAILSIAVAEATEEVVRKATAEFEQKLRKAIATSAMNVASYFDIERRDMGVVITVKDVRKS